MNRLPKLLAGLIGSNRPVLRVQLALLYAGVFVGLVVLLFAASSVLFGTANVFFGHSQMAAHAGTLTASRGDITRQFTVGPLLIALAAVALAVAAAWWLAGRFLRPLRTMAIAAREISVSNLDRRLNLAGPDDELTALGRTLDELFGRLQASFHSQRQFIANASHELRTPLAGQRTVLQVALADPDADTDALRSSCEEALQLSSQQERLIDALLTLATSERGIERWEPFELAELTDDAVRIHLHEAERRGIRIDTCLQEAQTTGDASLVGSMVANLIDNAIRHNVAGGVIEIATETTPAGARLSIGNTGPLVPAPELERLFQPFQRLGTQRLSATRGYGLGLAIVHAVATSHDATLVAEPRPQGGLDIAVTFQSDS